MVGATAFMETLELALELRRAGYGSKGERLGFDLYPYTEDAVGAVKRSVLQWRFIDGVAAKIDEPALARGAAGEGRRAGVRARVRRARRMRIGDLEVGRLGFGAMRLCGPGVWGEPADPGNALRVLRRAVELGIALIDTSDAYGPEVNELQIAEALYPYPEGLVIATKGGFTAAGPRPMVARRAPEHLREACEGSLRRLRLERIDVYQLHTPDPAVPLAESVGTLKELRDEGKIRHVGLSNVSLAELEEAERIVPIVSVQNRYNVADREDEDVLEACEARGIPFLPWAPLGSGTLDPGEALRFLLERSPVILPIPGTSSVEHLEENVRAVI